MNESIGGAAFRVRSLVRAVNVYGETFRAGAYSELLRQLEELDAKQLAEEVAALERVAEAARAVAWWRLPQADPRPWTDVAAALHDALEALDVTRAAG